eukprot:tig00000551_g2041.t1
MSSTPRWRARSIVGNTNRKQSTKPAQPLPWAERLLDSADEDSLALSRRSSHLISADEATNEESIVLDTQRTARPPSTLVRGHSARPRIALPVSGGITPSSWHRDRGPRQRRPFRARRFPSSR